MPIATTLKEVYLNANTSVRLIRTIQLSHPEFSQDFYLCQHDKPYTGKLENDSLVEFTPHGFAIELPTSSTKGQQNARFTIDATDEQILTELWEYKKNPKNPVE